MMGKCKHRINSSSLSPQREAGRYMQIASKLPSPRVNQIVKSNNELMIEAFGS